MGAVAANSGRRRWRRWFLAVALLGAYPVFVMVAVYAQFFAAGLPGGRNGPADAYRHTLASAIVAYTLSPRCVDWVTQVMERDGQGNAARAMDAHNNRIGARIGATAGSWNSMQQAVLAAVNRGAIAARSPEQITWLAPPAWQERLY
ncbi:hypothetical protein MNR01_02875 [Lysobacter sp. S4-A87]|uniref:DUF6973 domain-containing protein n=1 Tax=Lysobacter sp. S4-A87 TaxID=2925843 RepID=UPI001F532042|nr:hypothetical protein [Lysobacter sp. S4-A87]UNK51258.1 hypothetical protein MNR01_02875 [Lysobacter sp. S4-A87]